MANQITPERANAGAAFVKRASDYLTAAGWTRPKGTAKGMWVDPHPELRKVSRNIQSLIRALDTQLSRDLLGREVDEV